MKASQVKPPIKDEVRLVTYVDVQTARTVEQVAEAEDRSVASVLRIALDHFLVKRMAQSRLFTEPAAACA